MTTTEQPAGPLADIRVLDLAGESGVFAGRMLAELGAEVIRVEHPDGSSVRLRGPFLDGEQGPERSLYHLHFNAGKRGITLDIRHERGAALFRRLVAESDVVIETSAPGEMDALGLGFERLRAINPSLLYTTVTPFGQEGPMRGYRANDLIGAAMSGLMWLNGFPEDPPNLPGAEQAYHMASLAAASGTLVALCGRDRRASGEGGRIDVSVQEAASMATLQHASPNVWTWHRQVPQRRGITGPRGGRGIFQCADGLWISLYVPPYRWDDFLRWVSDEGIDAPIFTEEWRDPAYRIEHGGELTMVIGELFSRYTREQLFHEGQRRRLLTMPVNEVDAVVADAQLRARGYFTQFEHAHLGRTLTDTGAAYVLSETPAGVPRRAPTLGEHNGELYGGLLGMSEAEIEGLRAEGVI